MRNPKSFSSIFKEELFIDYPEFTTPQFFVYHTGTISNFKDENLEDVVVITSKVKSIRANHVHKIDLQSSYLATGYMKYCWTNGIHIEIKKSIAVNVGEIVFTPPENYHKVAFIDNSVFVTISNLNRHQEKFESDTKRLLEDFLINV